MNAPQPCPKCGAEIPPDARWGMCPKCLLDPGAAMAPEAAPVFQTSFGAKGRRFGDYDLGPQIGKGGMGVVYEAVQLRARRRVALKMILDTHATSPAARRRFAIEAEAAAKLDHPNIVPIFEVGEHEEQPFLSMKLVEGESLRHKIADGECTVPGTTGDTTKLTLRARQTVVARLMATVARAVHHAHQKGVIHRDLKPGNIIIDREGQPHLTDFGLAKILDPEGGDESPANITHSSAILGTPCYMSPEQATNKRLTAASDIYSLGAILYELLTGQPPFKGNTLLETIRLVIEQPPKRPRALQPATDPELETICLKCLEKTPEARYSSSLALAEDLERWLKQEPILARRASPMSRGKRWVKRNPVGTALIFSLCACLVVSLALLRLARHQASMEEMQKGGDLQDFTRQVEKLWESADQKDVLISSPRLAALAGLKPRVPAPANAVSLTFARTVSDAPVSQATRYAEFLRLIEQRMEEGLGRPVYIDLLLCKDRSWADPAVHRGEAEVQSLSSLTYVRLKLKAPGLQPIGIWKRRSDQGIIFARGGLGITNLSGIVGQRVVFAHTNSIVSFLAKVQIARAGISVSHLKSCVILDRATQREAPRSQRNASNDPNGETENEDYAHREVIAHVLTGNHDVGVATRRRFDLNKSRGQELVELDSFPIHSDVLVAGAALEPKMVEELRRCISRQLTGKELAFMSRFDKSGADGMSAAYDRDFDDLRAMLANELAFFENSRPASPPTNAPARPAR